MSVKQAYKDFLTLTTILGLIVVLAVVFYEYFQTNNVRMLYLGIVIVLLIALGTIARYRYVVDYIWTLFKKWR
jgi:hypothetical protein